MISNHLQEVSVGLAQCSLLFFSCVLHEYFFMLHISVQVAMVDNLFDAVADMIPANYVALARNASQTTSSRMKHMLTQVKL